MQKMAAAFKIPGTFYSLSRAALLPVFMIESQALQPKRYPRQTKSYLYMLIDCNQPSSPNRFANGIYADMQSIALYMNS